MHLRTKVISAAAGALLAGTMAIMPAGVAEAAPKDGPAAAKVADTTQAVTGVLENGDTFTGAIGDLQTRVTDGVLTLTGTITGTGLPAGGESFSQALDLEQVQADDACTILTLDLGPLHLDLLGLVVDLAPVNLDVTAVPGAGNLLGNLLCAVAGLLDNNGPLQGISALLNRLLSALGLGI